jgi:hypothetical protein
VQPVPGGRWRSVAGAERHLSRRTSLWSRSKQRASSPARSRTRAVTEPRSLTGGLRGREGAREMRRDARLCAGRVGAGPRDGSGGCAGTNPRPGERP